MSAELRKTFRISRNLTSSPYFVTACLLIISFACIDLVSGALRNVNLIIEPPAVRRGQHATLRCNYNLEGAPLYSAKFYRGQLEFYRYTPAESPSTKVFPFPGIYVDISMSNASQVLIRNVGFGLSGNFSCEVSADAPLFSTATAFGTMQVVELPEKRPLLFTEHNHYEPGDILRANCSSPPSRPRAELKFTINNMMITAGDTQFIRTVDNLIASRISLKLQLQGVHFATPQLNSHGASTNGHMMNAVGSVGGGGSSSGGGLVLRCTAQIDDLYQEYKELELGTTQRDPVPARVTLSSSSSMKSFFSSYFSSDAVPTRSQHRLFSHLVACSTLASLLVILSATNLWADIHKVSFMGSTANDSISTMSTRNKRQKNYSKSLCTNIQKKYENNRDDISNSKIICRTVPHHDSLPFMR